VAGQPGVRKSLAVTSDENCSSSLVELEPNTLLARSPRLRLGRFFTGPILSPDGRLAAVGSATEPRVVVARTERLDRVATIRLGTQYAWTRVLAWPAQRRLVALVVRSDAHRVGLTDVVVIDPVGERVLARAPFGWWASMGEGVSAGGRVAVLLVPWTHRGVPRLVVVGSDGRLRGVRLKLLRAGVGHGRRGEVVDFPALAVDRLGETAHVVTGRQPLASVDLRTLSVRYRSIRGLMHPSPSEFGRPYETGTDNPEQGTRRVAEWLGSGAIAVSGEDLAWVPELREASAPAGLQLLDLRTRRARTVRRAVRELQLAGGRLLARDRGLIAFDRRGREVYTFGTSNLSWHVAFGRVYVNVPGSNRAAVLDAWSGRTIGRIARARVSSLAGWGC
jgi:hypothetical protein